MLVVIHPIFTLSKYVVLASTVCKTIRHAMNNEDKVLTLMELIL